MKKYIPKMTGFKATNKDLTCQGHQFEVGKWHEIDGDVELCKWGFHFCVHQNGPLCYYNGLDARLFKIEAEQVLDLPVEAGADFKLVAKRIRLVEEILIGGDRNSGDQNSGDRNSGNQNSGNQNSGDGNYGYQNSGNRNSGYQNSGYRNSGNRNSGYQNSGDQNSGDRNSGDRNSGNWNVTNFSSGHFCQKEPKVISFDVQTKLTRSKFDSKYPEAWTLGELLSKPEAIDFERFKNIPGITKAKLESLHKNHLAKTK